MARTISPLWFACIRSLMLRFTWEFFEDERLRSKSVSNKLSSRLMRRFEKEVRRKGLSFDKSKERRRLLSVPPPLSPPTERRRSPVKLSKPP